MAKREWIWYPQNIELHTSCGSVFISITDSKHIYCDASGNGKSLEFRGKRYPLSVHLSRVGTELRFDVSSGTSSIYCGAPRTYVTKMVEAVITAVNAHIFHNPHLLLDADIADANNELVRREEELEEAVRAAEAARVAHGLAAERLAHAKAARK